MAILAIVALGVGFFAGLKVTKAAMLKTTGNYLKKQSFYDYRLLSTLGFTQEEVSFLRQAEGVLEAEGSASFDIICENAAGSESVAKVHSITEKLNRLVVLKGRMPERADECVADANYFTQDHIGETLTLSENNEETDLEHFAYRKYTIVGIVQSPCYIQYERGNTSLGTGKVSGFLYLPYEGFDLDYYTEIYVKFEEDFPLYSDEYQDFMDEKKASWETYAAEAADMRYQRLLADAQGELDKAKADFHQEKADAEKELADAWTELEDAREELEDAKKELADAQTELADGKKQLADARVELADAEKTITDKTRELADAERELADKEKELTEGEQELQDGYAEWNDGNNQLSQAEEELNEGRRQLNGQKAVLDAREKELTEGEKALTAAEGALEQQAGLLSQKEQELKLREQELKTQEQALNDLYQGNPPAEMEAALLAAKNQLAAGQEQLAEAQTQLAAGRAQLAQKRLELEAGRAAIDEGRAVISAYEQELSAGEEQLAAGWQELSNGKEQLEDAQRELDNGRAALEDAKTQIADGKKQLAEARQELEDARQTLSDKEQELEDGLAEYADGLAEYEDGLTKYKDGLAEYEDGKAEFQQKIGDAERELADAEQELADLTPTDNYLLGRDTNVGYVCFENDSSIVEGIANIFPLFFFLVAALVCVTTMNRMVEEQRTQIGVLKALGYSKGVIMSKYLFYSGSAAAIGCVAGYVGGTWLFPRVIWTAYGIMYRVDRMVYISDWKLAAISLTAALLCSMGTTWLSCRMELAEVAAQLMRPKSPKAGKRVFLEYFPLIWKRLGFLRKVSLRNIFRYKKRLIMMVMGISGCTALLVTGFGIKDSIANVAVQQFEEIQTFDLNVLFSEDISEETLTHLRETLGEFAGTVQYVPVCETSYDLVTEGGRKAINLLIFHGDADMAPFLDLHTAAKNPVAFPGQGELVITDKVAGDLNIRAGDTVRLQNEDMQIITARVSGLNQNFVYNYVYLNNETYLEQTGQEPGYRNLYLNLPKEADAHQISAALMQWDDVASVTVNEDTMERFSSMMKSLDLIVVFIITCAAGLAFIVLYNLTNINITERIREIATIKVLGFQKKETSSYVFRENMMLAAMGIGVGLPLGRLLHRFVMNEIHVDMIAFDIHILPLSYLYSAVLTFLFAWMINLLMGGKLERISMTESLKSVD